MILGDYTYTIFLPTTQLCRSLARATTGSVKLTDEFDGKVALVTVAGNGIGRAAALLFAQRGARVMVADLDQTAIDEVVERIRAAGGEAIGFALDVSEADAVRAMVDRTVATWGRLDCAFNNAGITHPTDSEWDLDGFRRTMEINLYCIMYCLKEELRHMAAQHSGAIVNTASVAGLIATGTPSLPGYTASKHAIVGLTKSAALKHARDGIRVNAVLPGITMTNIVKNVMEMGPEVREAMENFAPMGRMAQPEEIAEAALWLCSDRASYVTAHSLIVDGGFLAQ